MENADEAKKAVEALNESDFDGNTLSVQVKWLIAFVVFTNDYYYCYHYANLVIYCWI